MQLARKGRQTARGRTALLRFRQKAGLIRVQATVDWVKAQVEAERQVAVSVEFVETAADPIREALLEAGVEVAGIYGRDRFDVEAERLRFQRGEAQVCVFTVTASISLHAGELLPDGSHASELPRVGLFHQPRFSGIQARQVTGDRKSTRLNSSHANISYAVFCLKKKNIHKRQNQLHKTLNWWMETGTATTPPPLPI